MRYLTSQEAADYIGVSRATLYAYVSRGLVLSERPAGSGSRSRRYPQNALDTLRAGREARRDPAGEALRGGAPLLESSLSLIAGGRLYYRGLDACELSRQATLEEVACLLWTGASDGADDLFPRASSRRTRRAGSLADRLVACLVAERARHPVTLAEPTATVLRAAAGTVSALFDAAGATGAGTLAVRLARGWRAPSSDNLRAALILCADQELNTSAFTARCVASTDAPIHTVLLAALCALEGRRHGGAAGRDVCDLLDDIERLGAEDACRRVLARRGWLPGFGPRHTLYPNGDPRAAELLRRLDLPATDPAAQAIAFAQEVEGDAGPTLELALAALARRSRLPDDAAFALFALGRSVGWVAHALETAREGTLIRPRARYVGPVPDAG